MSLALVENQLDRLGTILLEANLGLGMMLLVGLSMALSHFFALLANRLTPRQIGLQLLLDALVLTLALGLTLVVDMLMLSLGAARAVQPSPLINAAGSAMLPGLFYGLVAAPYISDLIALTIWVLIHLNVVTLIHLRFSIGYGQTLLLTTPGYVLALIVVMALFHQGWQASYRRLASELEP